MVSDEAAKGLCLDDIPEEQLGDRSMRGWGKVLIAIDAAQECKSLTSVFVTKVLHRKRPNLVPINDSRLRNFYGIKKHSYSDLFLAIHRDVVQNREYLDELRKKYLLPNDVVMSRLRALDSLVGLKRPHMSQMRITKPRNDAYASVTESREISISAHSV